MPAIREAASFEGLLVLAVIYLVLNGISRAGRKPKGKATAKPSPPDSGPAETENFSLDQVLREIERIKQAKQGKETAPPARLRAPAADHPRAVQPRPMTPVRQDERGPLGRMSRVGLPSAEVSEERGTADDPAAVERWARQRERPVVDQDEAAEAVVERRIREAEARNRPISAADHAAFDAAIRQAGTPAVPDARPGVAQLRQAFIWREILGPPKSLE